MVALVTGDGGVGKSRLVAEALTRLVPAPAVTLRGGARAHSPAPYDWLASALAGRELTGSPVPPDALAWLTQRPQAPAQRYSPNSLLRTAVDLIRAQLGDGPALLVVEDLHDLDPASLALVAELANVPNLPAFLLVTSRAADEAAFPTLAGRVLARLAGGAGNTVRLHLSPLTEPQTDELITALLGAPTGPELTRQVHRRTGGNPFWLTELLVAYRGDRPDRLATGPLPRHIAALAAGQLSREQPVVRAVVTAAARLDEPIEPASLAAATGQNVRASVSRLIERGVLAVDPDGKLRFRHGLVREALATAAGEPLATAAGEPADEAPNGHPAPVVSAREHRPVPTQPVATGPLTARETEVLGCLAGGMSNQQVARELGISVRTVAVHVSNLLRKTGSASRTEAALWAVRHGLAGLHQVT